MLRPTVTAAVTVAVLLAAGALVPWAEHAAGRGTGPPVATAAAARGPGDALARAGEHPPRFGLRIHLSPAGLARAAGRCAGWATDAGFADNGYLGGALTTAVAVALAESGCNPAACYDDTRRAECTPPGRARDSVDRGAWQINSKAWDRVPDSCAYSGPCAGRVAYKAVSAYGTYFAPWAVYDADYFAAYLPAAQQAVTALRTGTVTSGMIGSCLAYPDDQPGAQAELGNCGSGQPDQRWRMAGDTLRTRLGLCLAVRSAADGAAAVLRRCRASGWQRWRSHPDSALINRGAHRCLADPGGAVRAGTPVVVSACDGQRDQAWFRP
ncbi:MAG: ricin-type beta-trefoil lectin domain protein [Streptosporangiaceae bacterium]